MLCLPPSSTRSRSRSLLCLNGSRFVRRKRQMLNLTSLVCAAQGLAFASGCNRAVLVPESAPIRLAQTINARVYVLVDGAWTRSDNRVELHEGWYVVPPSFVEDDQ